MARRKKNVEDMTTPTSTAVEEKAASPAEQDGEDCVIVALNRAQGIVFNVNGKKIEIAGNAVHLRKAEMGTLPIGAFGLTRVATEDWNAIKAVFGKTALFKSGRIFASDTKQEAVSEASDRKSTRHGLEPAKNRQTKPEEAATY